MNKKTVFENYGGGTETFRYAGLLQAGNALLAVWDSPLWAGLLAGLIYAVVAMHHGPLFGVSEYPYFNYLADAFLHGQLSLRLTPPNYHDLVLFGGQVYLYWPPLPAVLLMPFVALFGVNFSDVAFTVLVSAVVISLISVLLRTANQRQVIHLTPAQRGALVLFAAFGTVIFVLAPRGRVWFTGQMISLVFVSLAYIAALRLRGWKAFFFTGCALSAALWTRNTLLFAGIWPAYYLIKEHWQPGGLKRLARLALVGLAPVFAALLLLALYNWVRFGSPTDFGLDYHRMSIKFQEEYRQYGAFSLHYLSTNLFYNYLYYPFPIDPAQLFDGGSMFLLSPLFFAAVWAFAYPRKRVSAAFLLLTIIVLNIPILLLMGTGWVTFGPRYTLDFFIPMLLLTAMGFPRWPGWASGLAIFVSLVHYLFGALVKLP